jgi:hypothetical protein
MPTLRDWQRTPKDHSQIILQASTQDGKDGWTEFPIGMCVGWESNKDKPFIGDHSKTVLCAISTHTDITGRKRGTTRAKIVETLKENGISNISLSADQYFATLPSYKFVVSPEGNGIDCHRHYEALMAACIPIIERNPLTEKKYAGCPVLWTTDYSEITEEYLLKKYDEMIDMDYNFSALFLSSYPPHVRGQIKANGNFWMKKLTGKPFYQTKVLPFLKI